MGKEYLELFKTFLFFWVASNSSSMCYRTKKPITEFKLDFTTGKSTWKRWSLKFGTIHAYLNIFFGKTFFAFKCFLLCSYNVSCCRKRKTVQFGPLVSPVRGPKVVVGLKLPLSWGMVDLGMSTFKISGSRGFFHFKPTHAYLVIFFYK